MIVIPIVLFPDALQQMVEGRCECLSQNWQWPIQSFCSQCCKYRRNLCCFIMRACLRHSCCHCWVLSESELWEGTPSSNSESSKGQKNPSDWICLVSDLQHSPDTFIRPDRGPWTKWSPNRLLKLSVTGTWWPEGQIYVKIVERGISEKYLKYFINVIILE